MYHRIVRYAHHVGHHYHDVATAVKHSVPLSATPQVPQVQFCRRGHPNVTSDAAPGAYDHVVAQSYDPAGAACHGVVHELTAPTTEALRHRRAGSRRNHRQAQALPTGGDPLKAAQHQ
jgi:hypothetical protein